MEVFITARVPEEVLARITLDHTVEIHDEDQPINRARMLKALKTRKGFYARLPTASIKRSWSVRRALR